MHAPPPVDDLSETEPSRPTPSSDDWDQHWSLYAASAAVNPAQAYRRMLVFRALDLAGARHPVRVLEIGSGQGDLSSEITERYPNLELVGLDISETGVRIARDKVPTGRFFQQDLMQPMGLPSEYQAWATQAICSEVLEHVDDPLIALRHARGGLAPGGRLVITVPAGPMSAFDRHIGHKRHFTPAGLADLMTSAGLHVASVHGAGFPFFNLYRLTVIARGRKLIEDASDADLPATARVTMRAFSWLFRLNLIETLRGWQLVAVGIEPSHARPVAGTAPAP